MKISKPEILQHENEIVFRVRVESSEGIENLWYSLDKKFMDFLTDFCDAPLVALLIPAMAKGEDVYLAGTISERLWYNVSGPYQRLLQHVIPSLRRIRIFPGEVKSRNQRASGVATGFSCGIDSYFALGDHHYSDDVPAGFRVTHLLFNNVGSHAEGGERLFRERYARIEPVAERLGLPLITVNSNVDAFYGKGLDFQQTHTPRNASVPLLLPGGIGLYMYASAYSCKDAFVGATYDMAYSDTIALPLLSTEVLDAISVGSEYTRIEKTLRVAEIPDSYGTLDVCVSPKKAGNCSTCWKCMRTLLTLDIAGLIDRYSASFNLDAYKHRRSKYIGSVLRSRDPLLREIVQFARDRHYPFPFSLHLFARLQYPASLAKRLSQLPIQAMRKLKRSLTWKQLGEMSKNSIDSNTEGSCFNKIKLYYYNWCRNFGDEINKDILRYVGADYCSTSVGEANLIAIGSLLSTLSGVVTDRKPGPCAYYDCIDIWGAGFIEEKKSKKEFFFKNVKIHALRGKLSKARSEAILGCKLDGIALGDPGLLISRAIAVDRVEKKYDVGVIPHYVDGASDLLNKIKLQNKSYKIIDVQGDTRQICKEICECGMILSSALHGLITADSYGIPNRWIRFSDGIVGGNYKFNDYYSVFNIEGLEPVDLRKEIITDRDIDSFIANYPIKKEDVERICDDLEKAFPRKRFSDLPLADSKVFRKKCVKETLKTNPLVSIIVPSYNHAIYLPETLDSVLAQTYTHWECIIVNDGSSDNTEEIAGQYCKKDERLKYIYQKNSGPAVARNRGIKKSKGKFILPLDSDDLISKDYLTEAVSIFEANPATKLVYGEAEFFGEGSGLCILSNYSFDELLFSNMILCTAMYKRSDYDKTIGYNPNMKEGFEDWDFWLSLLKKDDLVYQIPKVHFYYRIRSNARNNRVFKNKELIRKMYRQIFSNHMALYEGEIDPLYTDYLLRQKNEELQQKEAVLNHIYNSHGWRALLIYYRLRDRILPINSKRRSSAKVISNVFLFRKSRDGCRERKKYR